ncbi:MAG: ABC transporter substrate-binding protein [Deltaproteobacteria bacterium]|nr:ABC transporter substrate-binding protein [Deltaproteobacteria bacterium]MDZ4347210.1 ABC transporter substrate-binding protein [Candidatus Binatia bacterium]
MIKRLTGDVAFRSDNLEWVRLVALVVAIALCGAVVAEAQPQAKVFKIGYLAARPRAAGAGHESLGRDLAALGHVPGKNMAFEFRTADNKLDRLPALAAELVGLSVDAIVTPAMAAAVAAKNATKTIPIVFFGVNDPVAAGLIDSLARPGGNVTGFTDIGAELAGKRLELLKETVPKLSRVAVLRDPQNQSAAQQWKESLLPARELGLQLHSMEVNSADKFESAFKEAIKARSTALTVTQSAFNNTYQKQIAELAAKHRLPAIYGRADFVDSGGLMSYGADQVEPYKRAAWMIDKIIKGTKPADIPVERPMRFELVLNFKTAKALGLTIPPIVLMRVTRVVK